MSDLEEIMDAGGVYVSVKSGYVNRGNSVAGFCNLVTEEERDHSRLGLESAGDRLSRWCAVLKFNSR